MNTKIDIVGDPTIKALCITYNDEIFLAFFKDEKEAELLKNDLEQLSKEISEFRNLRAYLMSEGQKTELRYCAFTFHNMVFGTALFKSEKIPKSFLLSSELAAA